jgi:hypothetical protein
MYYIPGMIPKTQGSYLYVFNPWHNTKDARINNYLWVFYSRHDTKDAGVNNYLWVFMTWPLKMLGSIITYLYYIHDIILKMPGSIITYRYLNHDMATEGTGINNYLFAWHPWHNPKYTGLNNCWNRISCLFQTVGVIQFHSSYTYKF